MFESHRIDYANPRQKHSEMSRHTTRLMAPVLALLCVGTLHADEWEPTFQEDFDTAGWEKGWTFSGNVGPFDKGALRNNGKELTATLDRAFAAPAVRVMFDASFTQANAEGKVSDLSCFVGPAFFQFAGRFNAVTEVRSGMRLGGEVLQAEVGKTHRVVIEFNGRLCTMTIDGTLAARSLQKEPLREATIALYTWAGMARFDNLMVMTKPKADALPKEISDMLEQGAKTSQTLAHLRDWTLPEVTEDNPAAVKRARVALNVDSGAAKPGTRWPVTLGVPLPKQTLWDKDQARVVGADGKEIPSQRAVTATWTKGGSIRWLLLDFVVDVRENMPNFFLEFGSEVHAASVKNPNRVEEDDEAITVTSGPARFVLSKQRGTVLEAAYLDMDEDGTFTPEEQVVKPSEAYFSTMQGGNYRTGVADEELSVAVETAGPVRTVVRSRGWYKNDKGERACSFTRRIYIYRGLPIARIFTTWTITVDTRMFTFTDAGIRMPLALKPRATVAAAGTGLLDGPIVHCAVGKEQAHLLAVAGDRHAGMIRAGKTETGVKDLPGWIGVTDGDKGVTLACYEMSRQWPAALEANPDELVFHAFSSAPGRNLDMTLNGLKSVWGQANIDHFNAQRHQYPSIAERNPNGCGTAKTHELLLVLSAGGDATAGRAAAETLQEPLLIYPDPVYTCETGVVGPGEYHPYDPESFPEIEAGIIERLHAFQDAVDRLEPWYGWWDYGSGMPYHAANNETGPVTYSGYRRTYDLGYQQPMVPWMYYLRSGQRPWLSYAVRNARGMMDMRLCHWENPTLNKSIGHATCSGTWPWDSNSASFGFNIFTAFLLLDYYTTGYERAMDVAIESMDAYCRKTQPGKASSYCGAVGTWLGNMACMWRATWEQKFLDHYKIFEQWQIGAHCKLCKGLKNRHYTKDEDHKHGLSHRAGWREYGFLEASQVPGRDPEIDRVWGDFGWNINAHNSIGNSREKHSSLGFSQLAGWRRTGDKLNARYALDAFRYNYAHIGFRSNQGLAHARSLPAWMKLAFVEGIEDVEVPVRQDLLLPAFIKHTAGVEQKFDCTGGQGAEVTAPDGKRLPAEAFQYDPVWRISTFKLGTELPSGIYTLSHKTADRLLVWMRFGVPIMVAIPEGIGFGRGKPYRFWFLVPKGTKRFRVRTNHARREVFITRPDGEVIAGKDTPWHTLDVPEDLPDGPWSIHTGYDYRYQNYILKLYDIPAMAARSPETVFEMPNPPMPAADYVGQPDDTVYLPGPEGMGQALHLNGQDELRIPLGNQTTGNSRERFTAQQGTVEFFFKLNENQRFVRDNGLPFRVPIQNPDDFPSYHGVFLYMHYKNAVNFACAPGPQSESSARFGPWDGPSPGMLDLVPGRWYHLAVAWDCSKQVTHNGKPLQKFINRTWLDGAPQKNWQQPYGVEILVEWASGGFESPMPGEAIEMLAERRDVIIDELRVSRVERADFNAPYPVPTEPYTHDEHTLLIMHFDGDVNAIATAGQPFAATFQDKH